MKPATVLIVEDEVVVALDLKERVTRLGYEVVDLASKGEQAVTKAKLLDPNVILMDIRLQGKMDGVAAATKIHLTNHTPIVYLTAYSDPSTLRRVMEDAPSAYLLKPVDERELEVALRAAVR